MNPPSAGAASRIRFDAAALSETAFISRPMPTTSGRIACLEGIISESAMPCATPAIIRCANWSRSKSSSRPTMTAVTALASCPACSTSFFGARSASTPPKTERRSIGAALPREITPSAAKLPVRSNAR